MPGRMMDCVRDSVTNFSTVLDADKYSAEDWNVTCPRTHDGFACWSETPAGGIAVQKCPSSIVDFDGLRSVYKKCSESGDWLADSMSNYTACVDVEYAEYRLIITALYVAGYIVSTIALLVALFIYCHFVSLSCARVTVHKNLFVSFICNNISRIVWYLTVANNYDVMEKNEIWCQLSHLSTNAFLVTTYAWMACQGLVLYQAVNTLNMERHISIIAYSIFGWVIPLLYIVLYTVARKIAGDTERCWTDRTETIYVIILPVVVCVLCGLVILLHIIWTLMTKQRPASTNQNQRATRKMSCATALLIPLFGLHYMLVPIRPSYNNWYAFIYHICSAFLTPLQGLFVSIVFCFVNHEVRSIIKIRIEHALRRRSNNIAMQAIRPAHTVEIT